MRSELALNQGAYWKFSVTAEAQPTAPNVAAGYNALVFSDDFNDTSSIDMANSKAAGFHWYLANWFTGGSAAADAGAISVSNSILTIGGGSLSSPAIVTAFDTGVTDAYTGRVFGGGGYFEARMKYDPSLSGGSALGAPAFFGMAIEHIADNNSVSNGHWSGQASNYAHFIELDFHEPNGNSLTSFLGSIHDWGGVYTAGNYPQDISNSGTSAISVGAVDFTQFHTYGTLWVPQNGSTPGRVQRYFDGVLYQSVYWLGPAGSPPLPVTSGQEYNAATSAAGDRTYSIIDSQNLALTLTGGKTWPLQIDWIKVWK